MRVHQRWATLLALAALPAAIVPSLLWGLVFLALLLGGTAVVAPRGVGRRVFPLAVVAVALASVEWVRLVGLPV